MKLEFDSVSELQQFLNWAYGFRPHGAPDPTANRTRDPIGPAVAQAAAPDTPFPKIDTGGVAFDTPTEDDPTDAFTAALRIELAAEVGPATAGAPEIQPAKRKRRTKAEIEADEKAAAVGATKPITTTTYADGTTVTGSGEHPAQSPAQQAAAEGTQAPTGTNPFEQAAAASGEPASEAGDGSALTEEPGEAVVTPFLHLTRAREFIAKHGMPKYNETFAKAGLDPNVMGYNAEQRAQHMAAMAELDKA